MFMKFKVPHVVTISQQDAEPL